MVTSMVGELPRADERPVHLFRLAHLRDRGAERGAVLVVGLDQHPRGGGAVRAGFRFAVPGKFEE